MPRVARGLVDNQIYHIINRGNRRESVFHDKYDYERFLKLLLDSKEKYNMRKVNLIVPVPFILYPGEYNEKINSANKGNE